MKIVCDGDKSGLYIQDPRSVNNPCEPYSEFRRSVMAQENVGLFFPVDDVDTAIRSVGDPIYDVAVIYGNRIPTGNGTSVDASELEKMIHEINPNLKVRKENIDSFKAWVRQSAIGKDGYLIPPDVDYDVCPTPCESHGDFLRTTR
jgi:hypothetical protein